MTHTPLEPLELSKRQGVPLSEVSWRLGITTDWLRRLARNPRHHRKILVAELEACLQKEKFALSVTSLIDPKG